MRLTLPPPDVAVVIGIETVVHVAGIVLLLLLRLLLLLPMLFLVVVFGFDPGKPVLQWRLGRSKQALDGRLHEALPIRHLEEQLRLATRIPLGSETAWTWQLPALPVAASCFLKLFFPNS